MTLTNGNDLGGYDYESPKSPTYTSAVELRAARIQQLRQEQNQTRRDQ